MSTANKLTYLNVTKQKLKQAINNIGGEVTDETTFRNYANQLQNVYDNLPKTEYQEGTEINLGVTSKGKLDFENGVVGIGQTEQDGEPTPSTPIAINSVTGNQDVVVSGKNEINVPEIIMSARSYIYRANIGSGNYSISITKSRIEGVTIGNQYAYMYKEIKFYDSNDTLLSTNTGTSAPSITNSPVTKVFNFTAPQNTSYMEIEFSNNNGDNNLNTLLSNVMLVSGTYNESTMPTYEPYITPTSYQLSLGDIELCGIGNYKDELIYDVDEDKVYKNEKIGKYQFTGNENITLATHVGNMYAFRYDDLSNNYIGREENQYLCTNYKQKLVADWDNEGIINVSTSVPYIYIFTTGDTASNVTAFKTWLANNKPLLYYRLETPTQTEITDTNLHNQVKMLYNAQSLNGTTIVTSSGNLPMIIKIRALKGSS